MNSLILKKKLKIFWDSNHVPSIVYVLSNQQQLAERSYFLQIYILLLNMILMSEKMTSQTIIRWIHLCFVWDKVKLK